MHLPTLNYEHGVKRSLPRLSIPDLPAEAVPTECSHGIGEAKEERQLNAGSLPGIRPPRSQTVFCLGSCGNEVSLGSPGVSQMVIKCDEGFDG